METGKVEYTRSKDSIVPRYTSPGHTKKTQISPLCTVILPTIRTKIRKPDTGSNGPNNASPETVPPNRVPKEAIPRADRHHMHKYDTIPTGSQEAVLCTNRRFTILWSRKSIPKGRGGQRTTSGMHFTHLHKNRTKLQHNKEGSVGTALHTAFHGLLPPICIKNRDSGGCPINPIPTDVQRQRRHSPTFLIRAVQIQCRNSTRPRRRQRSSGCPQPSPQGHCQHTNGERQSPDSHRGTNHWMAKETIYSQGLYLHTRGSGRHARSSKSTQPGHNKDKTP